jgi:NADPH2:quinone reductase
MQAVVVQSFGGPEVIEVADLPRPDPGPGQLRVRVAASSLNPIDVSTRRGNLTEAGLLASSPLVALGWDVAGIVDEIGADVDRFAVGDAVVGLRDLSFVVPGAHAECVVLDESAVALAPRTTSLIEAATLPLNGLTADGALARCGLRPGQSLLITGAAGGVGGYLLQLAAYRGVRTVAVAGAEDEKLVRELGATDFIDRTDHLAVAARRLASGGVDAVVDTAVIGIAAHNALRAGGTFVALVRPFAPPPIRGTSVVVHEVFADGARLAELAALVDAGLLTLRVSETFPLGDAARAHARFAEPGRRGRIVLTA